MTLEKVSNHICLNSEGRRSLQNYSDSFFSGVIVSCRAKAKDTASLFYDSNKTENGCKFQGRKECHVMRVEPISISLRHSSSCSIS